MRINHRQLEAFRAVMLTGSMTAAAELLHVTQPAVSRLIRDLERVAGFALFERVGTRIVPTADAGRLQEEVERHLAGLKSIERAIDDISSLSTGTLRVTAMTAPGLRFLPRIAAAFLARHQDVTLHLHTSDSRSVLEQVVLQHFELGFGAFRPDAPGAIIHPIEGLEAMIAIPASHPLAARDVVDIRDLDRERFVPLGSQGLLRHRIDYALAQARVRPRFVIETPLSATICVLVAEGVGIGIIDPFTALDVTDPRVAVRRFRPRIAYEFAVAHGAITPPSRLACDFADCMRAAIATRLVAWLEP